MGLTLKFLRDRGMMQEFTSLKQRIESSSSDFKFEHPLITKLHQSLVVEGDYDAAQACLHEMAEAGIFDDTLHSATPGLQWELIDDSERLSSTEENENRPCPRSGHQMLFVPPHEGDGAALYLFGGFNGHSSLADFWRFDLEADGMGGRWVSLGRFLDVVSTLIDTSSLSFGC